MTEYVTLITPDPADDAALTAALDAHRRRRPRDGRIRVFVPSSWRVVAVPSRSYVVPARDWPWRAWGR